jgi:hypothetical protein
VVVGVPVGVTKFAVDVWICAANPSCGVEVLTPVYDAQTAEDPSAVGQLGANVVSPDCLNRYQQE